ncbi:hypothetical protein DSO57_1033181 [Entomophthora muscae]|uniref:Uncharacterized protein n=1 Tax=Entomophthora muscae TaxID=34485 RepID=A0ACC2REX9_9FUNG|nr:hypothetical protein DSO57_1033181 [Entomophthora muscae]
MLSTSPGSSLASDWLQEVKLVSLRSVFKSNNCSFEADGNDRKVQGLTFAPELAESKSLYIYINLNQVMVVRIIEIDDPDSYSNKIGSEPFILECLAWQPSPWWTLLDVMQMTIHMTALLF